MSITSKITKVLAAFVVVAIATFGMASFASAETTDCTVYGLPGVSGIQKAVNQTGYMPALAVDGAMGPKTRAGVMAAQTTVGANSDGAWGPKTQAAYATWLAANCSEDGSSDNGDFNSNEEGELRNFDAISKFNNEEVGEGEDAVEVAGIEAEAKGADQMVARVNVIIDNPSDGAEDDLEDFITEVILMIDGEEIASMDVDEAAYERSDDEYTFRFTDLGTGSDVIISENDTADITVAVSAANSISSDVENEGWDVTIDEIRAVSPNGVTETYDADGDLPHTVSFTLETFSSANDIELKAKKSSDTPVEGVVLGEDNDEFDAELLAFELKAEGSDIEVYGLTIDLTSVGANVGVVANQLTLEFDGESYNETVSAAATTESVTFSDIDFTLEEGDTMDFTVIATMNEIDGVNFAEGDSLTADLDVSSIDAEDESRESVSGADLTGSANGNEQFFYSEGLIVTDITTSSTLTFSADDTGEESTGKFVIEFKAEAAGTDVYLDKGTSATTGSVAGQGIAYSIDAAAASTPSVVSVVFECKSSCGTTTDNTADEFYIEEGDVETYRLTVTVSAEAGEPDDVKVFLNSINWSSTDLAAANQFYSSELGEDSDADTGYMFLQAL